MEIAILRHGRPIAISKQPMTASQFVGWIVRYNESGIARDSTPTNASVEFAKRCGVIICSGLPRSIQSAKLLCSDKLTVSDVIFSEAGMPYASWKSFMLPPTCWVIIFRILWFCGFSKNAESYTEAKERACEATHRLVSLTQTHQSTLYVGHGIFNGLVAKELKSLGWRELNRPSSQYWSLAIYDKH